MGKLPYGISDYERLQENDYYYIDKCFYDQENSEKRYLQAHWKTIMI